MDHERKELLAQKKAQLKVKQQRAEIQQYKDHFTKSIQYFSQKYRYADEAEAIKLEAVSGKEGTIQLPRHWKNIRLSGSRGSVSAIPVTCRSAEPAPADLHLQHRTPGCDHPRLPSIPGYPGTDVFSWPCQRPGGRDHPAAGSREIPPGNCSGIVMDIPAQVW